MSVMILENEQINRKIINLFVKYKSNFSIHPQLYPNFKKNGILFIGINPSESETGFKNICKLNSDLNLTYKEHLTKLSVNNPDYEYIINFEKKAKSYNYFSRFKDIAKEINLDWEHIDLFYLKETNQSKFIKNIGKYFKSKFILNEFAKDQLELSKEIIEFITPEIIVVANSLASRIINNSEIFDIDRSKFDVKGYDYLILHNKKIPILFSSMLTGQRALDNETFRRFKWQIKSVLKSGKFE